MNLDYCEVRCPKKTYVSKYKRQLTCHRLAVRVSAGSKGEAYCIKHGTFLFDIDESYVSPPKKTITVQKAKKAN